MPDLNTALKIYAQRFGIEAMFKDCKIGGYNLEASQANPDRLDVLGYGLLSRFHQHNRGTLCH